MGTPFITKRSKGYIQILENGEDPNIILISNISISKRSISVSVSMRFIFKHISHSLIQSCDSAMVDYHGDMHLSNLHYLPQLLDQWDKLLLQADDQTRVGTTACNETDDQWKSIELHNLVCVVVADNALVF